SKEIILKVSEPMMNLTMKGYNINDNEMFTLYFSKKLKNVFESDQKFKKSLIKLKKNVGNFEKRFVKSIKKNKKYILVQYKGSFKKESGVDIILRLVAHTDKKVRIAGLTFISSEVPLLLSEKVNKKTKPKKLAKKVR
ncbi:MAG: hypothetical protein AAF518_12630, partial [Spirochaetota bacterium]